MVILYKFAVVLAIIGFAWILSRRLPRSPLPPGIRFRISGPAMILSWGLGLSFMGGTVAKLTSLDSRVVHWGSETSLGYTKDVFKRTIGEDSWRFLDLASRHLREHEGQPLYQPLFFEQHLKFQYPPTSLLGWDLVRLGRPQWVAERHTIGAVNLLMFPLLPLMGLLAAILLRETWIRSTGTPPAESRMGTFLFLAGGIAQAFLFYPLTKSWQLGQVQTLLSMLALVAILLWSRGKTTASGALIGMCCIVKPQWGCGLVWAALRRQWGFAAGIAVVSGLAVVASGILYGFGRFLEYLPVLDFLSRRGEAYLPNQSVNGILHRLLGNGEALLFQPLAYPPYHPLVHWGTFAAGLLLIGFAFWWKWRKQPSALDLGLSLTLFTMASPIAWEHHYGLLLGVGAAMAPSILVANPLGKATPWLLGLSWILVGQNFPILTRLTDHPVASLAANNLFYGALLLVALSVLAGSGKDLSTEPAQPFLQQDRVHPE